ncbi:MAG: D-alanine--D-alanine ligase A, partial [Micromonosporaceae bacterium]
LPGEVIERIRQMACQAFSALDCQGLARVDFFVTPELDIYLNELNTMPGFTSTSMFPLMWAASGLDYPKLLARLIRTAASR